MGELIGLIAVLCIFSTPIVAVLASHHRKVLELKLKAREQADQNVLAELRELKRQMIELRDTTTRYDVSFDTALQRLEGRVRLLEARLNMQGPSMETHLTQDR
ncbi:MAG TPA: hypothetical protein VNJ09_03395 [Chthonomonadales bacterium]|nr:hypothetical protein [Chthonomonadales bacterium]